MIAESGEFSEKRRQRAQETPDEGEAEYTNPPEEETYIGFGSRTNSPRIVVQMFTEEKRLEMDLGGTVGFPESETGTQGREGECGGRGCDSDVEGGAGGRG